MPKIKIESAYDYKALDMVVVGGEIEGIFNKGDCLVDVNNKNRCYKVKGLALFTLKSGALKIDLQLERGNYAVAELIGSELEKV